MPLKPAIPTLGLLMGGLLLILVPGRWRHGPVYRHIPTAVLGAVTILLCVLAVGPIAVGVYGLQVNLPMSIQALNVAWDGLALQCALIALVGPLLESALASQPELPRSVWAARLVGMGACIAGCAAADLVTLVYCWTLMDLALMAAELMAPSEQQVAQRMDRVWARGLSLLAMVMATMLLSFDQGRTAWAYVSLDATAQTLIVAAAWLRLGVFPVAGGQGVGPTDRLLALASGGYLWLRLVSVAMFGEPRPWLCGLLAVGSVSMGLVALLAQRDERRLEAAHLHGLVLMMLVPLLDSLAGPGLAAMTLVGLGLALVAQISWRSTATGGARWMLAPWLVVLGSLGGAPLTLLGDARWGLLRAIALAGQRWVLVLTAASMTLISVACWRAGRRAWREYRVDQDERVSQQPRGWRHWSAWGATACCALMFVVTAVAPQIVESVWRGGFSGIDIPHLRAMLQGGSTLMLALGAAVVVLPAAAILAVERFPGERHGAWYRGPIRDVIERFIAPDWLYDGLAQGLGVLQAGLRRLVRVIEESFVMGWTVFWALVFILYMVEL